MRCIRRRRGAGCKSVIGDGLDSTALKKIFGEARPRGESGKRPEISEKNLGSRTGLVQAAIRSVPQGFEAFSEAVRAKRGKGHGGRLQTSDRMRHHGEDR